MCAPLTTYLEPQQLLARRSRLALTAQEEWHLVGHNQRLGSMGLKHGSRSRSNVASSAQKHCCYDPQVYTLGRVFHSFSQRCLIQYNLP